MNSLTTFFKQFKQRKFIKISLGLMLFVGLIYLSLSSPNLNLPAQTPEEAADFIFENMKMSKLTLDDTSWSIFSTKAELRNATGVADMQNIVGEFYQDEELMLVFKAPTANVDLNDSNMVMSDATALFYGDESPVTLNARVLYYNALKRQFVGKEDIRIYSGPLRLDGDYFLVDIDSKKVTLSENTKAVFE